MHPCNETESHAIRRSSTRTSWLPIGPESAHQLNNNGAITLRYLCVSTTQPTDVVVFPDMRTIGVMAVPSMEAARRGEHWVQLMVPAAGAPASRDQGGG